MAVLKTTSPSPRTSAPSAAPTKARPSSRTSAAWRFLDGNDHRLVDAILLGDEDLDALRVRRGHVLADVVGADRQLSVAAVDEHDHLAVDVRHVRLAAMRGHAQVAVVAMLADVKRAYGHGRALELHEGAG